MGPMTITTVYEIKEEEDESFDAQSNCGGRDAPFHWTVTFLSD